MLKQNHYFCNSLSVCMHVSIIATLYSFFVIMRHALRFFRYTPITSTELPHFGGSFFYFWRLNQARISTCTLHV